MKKYIAIATLFAAGGFFANAADVGSVDFTGGKTYEAGTTVGDWVLQGDMTTGVYSTLGITFNPNVNIKSDWNWFSAGDYTVSIWVDIESLSSDQILFGYCGAWSSNRSGYNGLTWNAEGKTLTLGQGEWVANSKSFTYTNNKSTSQALDIGESGLVNFTLAVASANNGKMTADLWVNGVNVETLATYNGDMQNGADQMKYFVGTNGASFGTVSLTNEKLTDAASIKALAGIPEPSTFGLLAGLGALALVGARRRRR